MSNKKKIPCRVCGKLFTPCAFCESHTGVFRWRNFACSIECAKKYINKAVAYREYPKNSGKSEDLKNDILEDDANKIHTSTKRKSKKTTQDVVEDNH